MPILFPTDMDRAAFPVAPTRFFEMKSEQSYPDPRNLSMRAAWNLPLAETHPRECTSELNLRMHSSMVRPERAFLKSSGSKPSVDRSSPPTGP